MINTHPATFFSTSVRAMATPADRIPMKEPALVS